MPLSNEEFIRKGWRACPKCGCEGDVSWVPYSDDPRDLFLRDEEYGHCVDTCKDCGAEWLCQYAVTGYILMPEDWK